MLLFEFNKPDVDVDEMATAAQRKHIAKNKWQVPDEVHEWLRKEGFNQIGDGWYSVVYRRGKSNKVVKFSERQDVCYLEFAKYAKDHPNKHFPKVYDLTEYTSVRGDTMFITVLEYLEKVPFGSIDWSTNENREALAYYYTVGAVPGHIEDDATAMQILGNKTTGDHFQDSILIDKVVNKLKKGNSELAKAIHALDKVAPAECDYDIHDENIMYRKSDKSVVIIDPYSD